MPWYLICKRNDISARKVQCAKRRHLDEVVGAQLLLWRIAPVLQPDLRMELLGKGLREAISDRLH
jgi:hypothetical protein